MSLNLLQRERRNPARFPLFSACGDPPVPRPGSSPSSTARADGLSLRGQSFSGMPCPLRRRCIFQGGFHSAHHQPSQRARTVRNVDPGLANGNAAGPSLSLTPQRAQRAASDIPTPHSVSSSFLLRSIDKAPPLCMLLFVSDVERLMNSQSLASLHLIVSYRPRTLRSRKELSRVHALRCVPAIGVSEKTSQSCNAMRSEFSVDGQCCEGADLSVEHDQSACLV